MTGLIHIYCGDGKGKTTAAIGAAVRAAGAGLPVLVCRFLKTDHSGEVAALFRMPGVEIMPCTRSFGFSWNMTEEQKREAASYYTKQLQEAIELAPRQGLLILDEAIGACAQGFIEEEMLLSFLERKPEQLEVILTGRNPSELLLGQADYVTEMKMIKHPYEKGVGAREGIEY